METKETYSFHYNFANYSLYWSLYNIIKSGFYWIKIQHHCRIKWQLLRNASKLPVDNASNLPVDTDYGYFII